MAFLITPIEIAIEVAVRPGTAWRDTTQHRSSRNVSSIGQDGRRVLAALLASDARLAVSQRLLGKGPVESRRSVLLTFLVSGIFHEVDVLAGDFQGHGHQLAFFTFEAGGAASARSNCCRRGEITDQVAVVGSISNAAMATSSCC
ncbi:MAG: hypothetical protein U0790_00900 [Isosphaeraceae bacterium]